MQAHNMMIVQIDYGEFWCSYWLTTHLGPKKFVLNIHFTPKFP